MDQLDQRLRHLADALKQGNPQALESEAQALRDSLSNFARWADHNNTLHPTLTPQSQMRLQSACAHLSVLRQAINRNAASTRAGLNVLLPAPAAEAPGTYDAAGQAAKARRRSFDRA